MIESNCGRWLNAREIVDWVGKSLVGGSILCEGAAARLDRISGGLLVVPSVTPRLETGAEFDHDGKGIRQADVDSLAERVFESLHRSGARTLLVEDDLREPGNPHLEPDVSLINETVIHWLEIGDDHREAVRLLRHGASGYPLSAFVSSKDCRELGLERMREIPRAAVDMIVDSMMAIVVTAYDAEALLFAMFGGDA